MYNRLLSSILTNTCRVGSPTIVQRARLSAPTSAFIIRSSRVISAYSFINSDTHYINDHYAYAAFFIIDFRSDRDRVCVPTMLTQILIR